tara:strand:- start:486 stop:731 length:246 start_codon:yes stop_codon:yes gene_type:complete
MKPTLKIPSALHARIMTQLVNLPIDVIIAGMKKLNSQQWQEILDGQEGTAKSTMNRAAHLRGSINELQSHLINQISIDGIE